MKILHVTSSLDPRGGGVAEALRQLAPALVRLGHHTEIATLDAPGESWLDAYTVPVHTLGPTATSYQYARKLYPWLRAQRDKFDCVISHGLWQHHGFATWRAWRQSPGRRFVFTHGMLDPWFKRAHPLKHLKKWLYWPWAEYRILRSAKAVFFTCEEEGRLARESFWLYRCNETIASLGIAGPPDGAERQKQAFLKQFPELRDCRLLLFLGRVHPKKGVDLLLRAFAESIKKHPGKSLRLVIAGPGDESYLSELRAMLVDPTHPSEGCPAPVVWTGMLEGDLKWGALHAAEAFVLPSHQENFGLAVVEALACGVSVLISDKVNIWREIVEDRAGLCAPDDLSGTVRLLDEWLSLDIAGRDAYAAQARRTFESRFQIDTATAALVEKLRELGVTE